MKLTYIFHSCFALETERAIVIFDYWQDPSEALQRIRNNGAGKHIYVFASHFHEDHFNREIFQWRNDAKMQGTESLACRYTYILSKDILKHRRAAREEADVWISKGGFWEDGYIKVHATGSNDSGVSWIVDIEDKRIFHAGDLCNWYARFLTDDIPDGSIYSYEFGKYVNPVAEEKRFLGELKDIGKISKSFDLVLFPVDGRIGNGYTRGGRQFIERFNVGMFVPMHFVASGFESAWRMEPFCKERNVRFWSIKGDGESIEIQDEISIRPTLSEDIPRLLEIFSIAREFMRKAGNPSQWSEEYPGKDIIANDISNGDSYVCIVKGKIVATFVLREGEDPTYSVILNGEWKNNNPYATIHRIASSGETKGIFRRVMQYACQRHDTIRIDTHRDNKPMRQAIEKAGFEYCGIIHCQTGGERLAYQYDKTKEKK